MAQAPVPQASVRPLPRSQTTRSISVAAHARELDVGAAREPIGDLQRRAVRLGQRAQVVVALDEDDGVRVPHRDGGEPELAVARPDRLAQRALAAGRRKRDLAAGQARAPHLLGDVAHRAAGDVQRARQHAGAGLDVQRRAAQGRVGLVQHLGHAAQAVAAHLGLAAVGVEHAHARVAAGAGQDRQHAVRAHAEVAVADLPDDRRVLNRLGGLAAPASRRRSTTTKSFPVPSALTNGSGIVAPPDYGAAGAD